MECFRVGFNYSISGHLLAFVHINIALTHFIIHIKSCLNPDYVVNISESAVATSFKHWSNTLNNIKCPVFYLFAGLYFILFFIFSGAVSCD